MVIPAFLANQFSPLHFSSITGYPNHVPLFHEWKTYLPQFTGNTYARPDQHLKDFHECMEQHGIIFEDMQMKIFMYSLEEEFRVCYRTIPHGSISCLKCFHIAFHHYCKRLYPPNSLFDYCCTHFNVKISLRVMILLNMFMRFHSKKISTHIKKHCPVIKKEEKETSSSYK